MSENLDYLSLNASSILLSSDGKMQLEKDKEAAREYFLQHVNQNTIFFHDLEEKLKYLVEQGYYEKEILDMYSFRFIKSAFKRAYGYKFRFPGFLSAYKFYTSYALRTRDGSRYLERYEDRIVVTALTLAQGNQTLANKMIDEFMSGTIQTATPTFNNAGKKQRGEYVSCFLLRVEDNMESIGESIRSALQLSKRGGGVALNLTNLRERGAAIKGIENMASGVVPVMKMLEDAFSYANQLGQRQGAGAVYISMCHPDIEEFLDTKRENADEKIRIKTLSMGVVVPDVAFECARENKDLYLFSPGDIQKVYGVPMSEISVTEKYHEMVNDSRIRKRKVNARKLFTRFAEIQAESGYPYILFEDNVNREHIPFGRVSMSNLCVTGDTKILTKNGYQEIEKLAGTVQTVWNGLEWSENVPVVKTAKDQEILEVTFDNGTILKSTPYHKFYVVEGNGRKQKVLEKRTSELNVGDRLEKFNLPVIEGDIELTKAYTNGFYTGDGCEVCYGRQVNPSSRIYLYGEKQKLKEHIEFDGEWIGQGNERLMASNVKGLMPKYFVPNANYTVKSRIDWIAGVMDSDGTLCTDNVKGSQSVQIGSTNKDFLVDVMLMLQTLGVFSKVTLGIKSGVRSMPKNDGSGDYADYNCKDVYRLHISCSNLQKLINLGLETKRLELRISNPNRDALRFTRVVSVRKIDGLHDTFCVTEPKRNRMTVEGILTGNCIEILQTNEATVFDDKGGYKEIGKDISCNLASTNIAATMDRGNLEETFDTAIRALTAVSDISNISIVPSIKKGNDASHSVGLGQMNLHGFLAREGIHYDSQEALDFASAYFAAVAYYTVKTSNKIAIERKKTFEGFEKSKYATGEYFDRYTEQSWLPKTYTVRNLFEKFGIELPTTEDWKALKESVIEHGIYNKYLRAIPPTGSISYVNNSTSSIHPITAKIEIRKEGKMGRVYYPAPFLTNENSIFYRDAYEIGPDALIDMYAAAAIHTDQGISATLFFNSGITTRDINKAQIRAWKKGVKAIYYIRLRDDGGSAMEKPSAECESCAV